MNTTRCTILVAALLPLMTLCAVVTLPTATTAQTVETWKAPARAARKKNPVVATPKSILAGGKVFQQMCAVCHGTKAKGNGPAGAGLKPKPQDLTSILFARQADGEVFWKIRIGRTPMPTFGPVLKEEQVWNVVNYLRSLGPKKQKVTKANPDATPKATAKVAEPTPGSAGTGADPGKQHPTDAARASERAKPAEPVAAKKLPKQAAAAPK